MLLLWINITSLFLHLFLLAKYSVTPKYLLLKIFLSIGAFIKPKIFLLIASLWATSKHLKIYFFTSDDLCLNIELYFNGMSKIRSLFLISISLNSSTLNNGIFIFNFKNCSSIRE